MLNDKPFDRFQLMRRIPEVRGDRHRFQPNLGRKILTINVNMWRFARFMAMKVHPMRPASQNRWHLPSLPASDTDCYGSGKVTVCQ
jgi:hypothetical protein